jgi:hypothetical protein
MNPGLNFMKRLWIQEYPDFDDNDISTEYSALMSKS